MTWLLTLKTKLLAGLAVLGAVIAAVGFAWLKGRREGVTTEKQKADAAASEQKAAEAQATVETVQHDAEVRHDVETETAKLPDAAAQQVGAAAHGTAAGELRDDGWAR